MTTLATTPQSGKNWFITGASSGFGRVLAEYLCSIGAKVVATARKVDDLSDFTLSYPGHSFILPLDVTDEASIRHAHDDALAHVGHIDVLVNNAGFGVLGAVEEVTAQEYMPMFETNLFGVVNVTKAFLPDFREWRSGTIVNMSSIGGLVGGAGWGYYNATKFALEGLSQALAAELEAMHVRVMMVEPGPFRTDFLGRSGQEASQEIADYRPTVGKTREYMKTQDGKQPGDPRRAAKAIVEAVSAPVPPQHLLLGKLALTRYRDSMAKRKDEVDAWEDTTLGADYPENSAEVMPPYADAQR